MRTLKNTQHVQHVVGAAPTSGAEAEHQEGTNLEEGPVGLRSRALWGGCSHGLLDGGKSVGCSKLGLASRDPPSGGASGNHWQIAPRCLQSLLGVARKLSFGVLVELYKPPAGDANRTC